MYNANCPEFKIKIDQPIIKIDQPIIKIKWIVEHKTIPGQLDFYCATIDHNTTCQ